MKKITSKEVFLLVFVIGFAILALVYMLVYLKYTQETTRLESSNRQLQSQVNELKQYYDKMGEYKNQIADMTEGIDLIVEKYPVDAREEDAIMLALRAQQASKVNYNTMIINENSSVHTIPASEVVAAKLEGYSEQIDFVERAVTYNNETDYENLKEYIAAVYEYPAYVSIQNVAYSADETTGLMKGVVDIFFYSMSGIEGEYVAPDISEYISGTQNPFKVANN